ncbi:Rho-binding antiterminator [Shewanella sp. TC10]|uniref:Rho-binding antiterminator n=1 Tax=Shewanella sp. TC10 TaxID=1419739 RepID=UPI00129D619E|nr:Rho-binding antiterminator [Shewanella sp. TC10]
MLKCDLHDYIEILCLYRYHVELSMKDSSIIDGVFFDTGFSFEKLASTNKPAEKVEVIKGQLSQTQQPIIVEIRNIKHIKVLTENAKFTYLTLRDD